MFPRCVRWCSVALAAAGAGAVVAAVWLNGAGFCFSERRFLSDTEKITAAANYAMRGFHVTVLARSTSGMMAPISVRTPVYEATADFLAANPGCCRMAGPGNPVELGHPEWGERRSVVIVDMAVPFSVPGGGGRYTATFRTNIAVHPCGYVYPRRIFKQITRFEELIPFG